MLSIKKMNLKGYIKYGPDADPTYLCICHGTYVPCTITKDNIVTLYCFIYDHDICLHAGLSCRSGVRPIVLPVAVVVSLVILKSQSGQSC